MDVTVNIAICRANRNFVKTVTPITQDNKKYTIHPRNIYRFRQTLQADIIEPSQFL